VCEAYGRALANHYTCEQGESGALELKITTCMLTGWAAQLTKRT